MATENNLVSVREAATAEIKQHLDTIGTSYIKVGSCLNELRGDFEGQKTFWLMWSQNLASRRHNVTS